MSRDLANRLDLRSAWLRVKGEERGSLFVRKPNEIDLAELDLEEWLNEVLESIAAGTYNPSPMVVCDVPKPKSVIRPGAILTITDRVVYSASVHACLRHIHAALAWSQGRIDFAHQLAANPDNPKWFQNQFRGWEDFRKRSLHEISRGASFVLITDISAFYENIEIGTLISDLRATGAPADVVDLIGRQLNRWAQVPNRGVPQGHMASDLLAKLYLNSVDHNYQNQGFNHLRYSDDVRVFCRTKADARRAVVVLSQLLRRRGLSLQTAKTDILVAAKAAEKIQGVIPIIKNVAARFTELVREAISGDPYISVHEADELLSQNPDDAPIEIIRETYQAYFVNQDDGIQFDVSLFRFLLRRLGNQADGTFVPHCLTLLEKHPEETHTILEYFKRTGKAAMVEGPLIRYTNSPDAPYAYQNFQILELLSAKKKSVAIGSHAATRSSLYS
jgi:retron-type reverse transcriptase